jgi:uncharacterized Zn finger protein
MPRENAQAKAIRLLVQGRVSIIRADEHGIDALVKGDTAAFYRVSFRGRWTCNCDALSRCSHALAVQRVTIAPGSWVPVADVMVTAGTSSAEPRERRLAAMRRDPSERGRPAEVSA